MARKIKNISIAKGWTLVNRNGIWHLRINHQKRQKWISTGANLESVARVRAGDIWRKYHASMSALFAGDIHTADAYADIWALYEKKRQHAIRPQSLRSTKGTLDRFYANYSRTQIVKDTAPDDIIRYLSQPHFAPDTRNKEFINLHAFFNKCVQFGFIPQNPMRDENHRLLIDKPKRTSRMAQNWRETEVQKIIVAIKHDYEQKRSKNQIEEGQILGLIPIIWIAVATGLRISEIRHLRWSDVDFAKRRIYVRAYNDTKRGYAFDLKGYEERLIPMNTLSEHYLLQMHAQRRNEDDTETVFVSRRTGGRRKLNYVSDQFREYARMAGVYDGRSFHDLRKLYATKRMEAGASLIVIQKELGHKDIETTMKYLGINIDTDLAKNDAIFADLITM